MLEKRACGLSDASRALTRASKTRAESWGLSSLSRPCQGFRRSFKVNDHTKVDAKCLISVPVGGLDASTSSRRASRTWGESWGRSILSCPCQGFRPSFRIASRSTITPKGLSKVSDKRACGGFGHFKIAQESIHDLGQSKGKGSLSRACQVFRPSFKPFKGR